MPPCSYAAYPPQQPWLPMLAACQTALANHPAAQMQRPPWTWNDSCNHRVDAKLSCWTMYSKTTVPCSVLWIIAEFIQTFFLRIDKKLAGYLSIYLSIYPSIYLSIYLSIYFSMLLLVYFLLLSHLVIESSSESSRLRFFYSGIRQVNILYAIIHVWYAFIFMCLCVATSHQKVG